VEIEVFAMAPPPIASAIAPANPLVLRLMDIENSPCDELFADHHEGMRPCELLFFPHQMRFRYDAIKKSAIYNGEKRRADVIDKNSE
jgi:hypothetical protein